MSALNTRSFDRWTYSAYMTASTLCRARKSLSDLGDLNSFQRIWIDTVIRHNLRIAITAPKLNKAE
jgi:hypothetical protein